MKQYKKTVDLPTGVKTKIKDTLEGEIEVVFTLISPFNKDINTTK